MKILIISGKEYSISNRGIDVALGNKPDFTKIAEPKKAAVRFIFTEKDMTECEMMLKTGWQLERKFIEHEFDGHEISDSSNRYGYYIMKGDLL